MSGTKGATNPGAPERDHAGNGLENVGLDAAAWLRDDLGGGGVFRRRVKLRSLPRIGVFQGLLSGRIAGSTISVVSRALAFKPAGS